MFYSWHEVREKHPEYFGVFMKAIHLILVFAASLLFISCSSIPAFLIKSSEKESEFYMGREYVSKEDTSARIILNFEDQDKDVFVFYIKVKSFQDSSFIFDPGKIFVEIVEPELDKKDFKIFALDPEGQIEQINHSINSATATKQTTDGLNFILAVADIAGEIATIGKEKSEEEIEEKQAIRDDWQKSIDNNEADYNDRIADLNNKKYFWQNNVLRKTTMYLADTIEGFIYIPCYVKGKLIKVNVPVGNALYSFLYNQTRK